MKDWRISGLTSQAPTCMPAENFAVSCSELKITVCGQPDLNGQGCGCESGQI